MNKKSLLLVFILCGLILTALILRNGKLLLLAMPFLTYLLVGMIQAPGAMALQAERTIDKPSVIAQEPVEARLVVKNQGKSLVNLYLDDRLYPSISLLDGQAEQKLFLPAGGTSAMTYKFKATRGVYAWNTVHARSSDPFGLFDLKCSLPATGEVLVRPAPLQIRPTHLKPRRTLHASGPISARLAGSGTDFWGVREYHSGDSLRRLNWRLTARHPQKLFTNEYEREEIADFGLILDARKFINSDKMEEVYFEFSVSAAASLSENFLRAGNRVSLLVYGKPIISIFPGYGKKHLNRLQRNLARAKPGADLPFNYLEYFPARLFPTRSVIVIFSSVLPGDVDVYAQLRAYGYDVLLISPDPVEFAAGFSPSGETDHLALRAARVERVIQLKRLLKLGVTVIDWQVHKPLDRIIHKSVMDMIRRRNI